MLVLLKIEQMQIFCKNLGMRVLKEFQYFHTLLRDDSLLRLKLFELFSEVEVSF